MVDILRILFYMIIGIPFIYMAYDVLAHISRGTAKFYSRHLKPAVITVYTSLIRN